MKSFILRAALPVTAACAIMAPAFMSSAKQPALAAIAAKADPKSTSKDSTDFRKKLGDCTVSKGMFTTYLDKKGKLLFEIPDSALNHTYMLVNRVNSLSQTNDYVAGQMIGNPQLIKFTRDDQKVYLHLPQTTAVISPEDPILPAFNLNFDAPIVKGFKIEHSEPGKVFVDMTSFLGGNDKLLTPIKETNPLSKLLGGKDGIKGTYNADGSSITSVKAFPQNVEVKARLAFTTSMANRPYMVTVSRSIVKLPDNPMPIRLHDKRVGYFSELKNLYSSNLDGSRPYEIISRHRLEPRDEDREAYFAGKLVEPKKKIVFYVDSAFPAKWRPAVKEGIEYWNKAFEAAGFKNAVEARDYPKNDPDFDPDDIRYSCVRYSVSPTANAMGPSYTDPRTGEIIGADVIWYHNILQLVHDWRFTQTAAVDPRVRTKVFADSVMHESLTYVAAHEIGHCLGLMHNMGASYSFTLDNLRDPAFTQKHGTTPSIMDYARNNFVAQPGDRERGVRLTPPPVGVYDIYAINWGYRLIPGADTPEAEKATLTKWIEEKAGDPMYEFGAQQFMGLIDPTDQTEDLGNDHIKAGDMAISNLKIIMNNFEDWAGEPNEYYDFLSEKYDALVKQYLRHVGHVYPYIGGVKFREIRQGKNSGPNKTFFSKADQKRAMKWLFKQVRTNDWLAPRDLIAKFEEPTPWREKMQRNVVACMFVPTTLQRIKDGGEADPKNNYTLPGYINDVFASIFEPTLANKPLNDAERNMQNTAIDIMAGYTGLMPASASKNKSLADEHIHAYAIDEFAQTLAMGTAPELPCGHSHISAVEAGDRSFYRLIFNQPTLPATELRPMMTSLLKRTLALYKGKRATATDAATRDFYDYQIIKIQNVLDPK